MERKELLVTVLIGILLVTTAMQTIALASLSSGNVVTRAVSSPSPSSSPAPSSSQSGSSLQNLDSMVGGC